MVTAERTKARLRKRAGEQGCCHSCGQVLPLTDDLTPEEWEELRYCSPECEPAYRWSIEEVVEELMLHWATDSWENIERRMGYARGSLRTRLKRHGLHQLADRMPNRYERIDDEMSVQR